MNTETIHVETLRKAELGQGPFPYIVVPNFVKQEAMQGIEADYPLIDKPGSFPLPTVRYGKVFKQFIDDITGPSMTDAISEKFSIDLQNRPTMVTVRGQCRASDGQIHRDSVTKLITVLIYMNGQWERPGGRLRLLRSADNLDDVIVEVPPEQGTLLAFKNQDNAWHGHESYVGQRRSIQLNWVRDQGVVFREHYRHRFSAFLKRLRA